MEETPYGFIKVKDNKYIYWCVHYYPMEISSHDSLHRNKCKINPNTEAKKQPTMHEQGGQSGRGYSWSCW